MFENTEYIQQGNQEGQKTKLLEFRLSTQERQGFRSGLGADNNILEPETQTRRSPNNNAGRSSKLFDKVSKTGIGVQIRLATDILVEFRLSQQCKQEMIQHYVGPDIIILNPETPIPYLTMVKTQQTVNGKFDNTGNEIQIINLTLRGLNL